MLRFDTFVILITQVSTVKWLLQLGIIINSPLGPQIFLLENVVVEFHIVISNIVGI